MCQDIVRWCEDNDKTLQDLCDDGGRILQWHGDFRMVLGINPECSGRYQDIFKNVSERYKLISKISLKSYIST